MFQAACDAVYSVTPASASALARAIHFKITVPVNPQQWASDNHDSDLQRAT